MGEGWRIRDSVKMWHFYSIFCDRLRPQCSHGRSRKTPRWLSTLRERNGIPLCLWQRTETNINNAVRLWRHAVLQYELIGQIAAWWDEGRCSAFALAGAFFYLAAVEHKIRPMWLSSKDAHTTWCFADAGHNIADTTCCYQQLLGTRDVLDCEIAPRSWIWLLEPFRRCREYASFSEHVPSLHTTPSWLAINQPCCPSLQKYHRPGEILTATGLVRINQTMKIPVTFVCSTVNCTKRPIMWTLANQFYIDFVDRIVTTTNSMKYLHENSIVILSVYLVSKYTMFLNFTLLIAIRDRYEINVILVIYIP